jgi:hypothetical protein
MSRVAKPEPVCVLAEGTLVLASVINSIPRHLRPGSKGATNEK